MRFAQIPANSATQRRGHNAPLCDTLPDVALLWQGVGAAKPPLITFVDAACSRPAWHLVLATNDCVVTRSHTDAGAPS